VVVSDVRLCNLRTTVAVVVRTTALLAAAVMYAVKQPECSSAATVLVIALR
jgi:hypothetical protein